MSMKSLTERKQVTMKRSKFDRLVEHYGSAEKLIERIHEARRGEPPMGWRTIAKGILEESTIGVSAESLRTWYHLATTPTTTKEK